MADTLKLVRGNGWRVDSIQVVRHGKLVLLPTNMARLGLLWLNDGVWQDRRILPSALDLVTVVTGKSGDNEKSHLNEVFAA